MTRVADDLEGRVVNEASVSAASESGPPEPDLRDNEDTAGADLGPLSADPPADPSADPSASLPRTGTSVLGLVLVALGLILGGRTLKGRRRPA